MRFLINIPDEFEWHFQNDRFKDSLNRLSADAHLLAGNYEREFVTMLIESFKNAVLVSQYGRWIEADLLIKVLIKCSEDDLNKDTVPFSWAYAYECMISLVEAMPYIGAAEGD